MFTNTGTSIRIRFSAVRLEVSTLLPTETCFWRTLSFWLISMLYIACCKIYTWLFLANVREVQWVSVVKFARARGCDNCLHTWAISRCFTCDRNDHRNLTDPYCMSFELQFEISGASLGKHRTWWIHGQTGSWMSWAYFDNINP